MILDALTTIASGGVLGMIGSMLGKGFGLIDKIQESKARQQAWEHERAMLELTQKYQRELADQAQQSAQKTADAKLRIASYSQDSAMGQGSVWVINLLRLVRPVLTLGLVGLTAMIWYDTSNHELLTIHQDIASTIVFCTTAALSWWFGDRTGRG